MLTGMMFFLAENNAERKQHQHSDAVAVSRAKPTLHALHASSVFHFNRVGGFGLDFVVEYITSVGWDLTPDTPLLLLAVRSRRYANGQNHAEGTTAEGKCSAVQARQPKADSELHFFLPSSGPSTSVACGRSGVVSRAEPALHALEVVSCCSSCRQVDLPRA